MALEPPGGSVTALKWAPAEPPTAGPPLNRKPCAGSRGPPPCSDEPAVPRNESEERGAEGRGSGAAATEKLSLRHRSEAALPSSRSVHVDGPKRKSLGRTEGEPAGGLPTATCTVFPGCRAPGRLGARGSGAGPTRGLEKRKRGPRAAGSGGVGGAGVVTANVSGCPALALTAFKV